MAKKILPHTRPNSPLHSNATRTRIGELEERGEPASQPAKFHCSHYSLATVFIIDHFTDFYGIVRIWWLFSRAKNHHHYLDRLILSNFKKQKSAPQLNWQSSLLTMELAGGPGKSWLAKINPTRNSSINPDIRPLIHVNTHRPHCYWRFTERGRWGVDGRGYFVINDWPLLPHLPPWTGSYILSGKFVLFGIINIHRKQLVVGIRTTYSFYLCIHWSVLLILHHTFM